MSKKKPKPIESLGPKPLFGGRAAYGLAFLSGFLYFVAFPGIALFLPRLVY